MEKWLIAKSNMRKNLTATVIMFLLIMVASIFLYVGANVLLSIGTFMDEKKIETKGADFLSFYPSGWEHAILQIMESQEGYEASKTQPVLLVKNGEMKNENMHSETQSSSVLMLNVNQDKEISGLNLIQKDKGFKKNSIILPYYLEANNGYKIGDTIQIKIGTTWYDFEVYDFAEDIYFASPLAMDVNKYFVSEAFFDDLLATMDEKDKWFMTQVEISEGVNAQAFEEGFIKTLSTDASIDSRLINGVNYETMKKANAAALNIIMAILIVFAFIILFISLIIIRFTIITHIEDNIKNIGVLEAMGYTNTQILQALVLQFMTIGLVSTSIGVSIAVMSTHRLSMFISSAIGLKWVLNVNIMAMLVCFITIMLLIGGVTLKVGWKIKGITPITALRRGISTHHFEKNNLPLDKSILPIQYTLGIKSILHHKKQTVAILFISATLAFTSLIHYVRYCSLM